MKLNKLIQEGILLAIAILMSSLIYWADANIQSTIAIGVIYCIIVLYSWLLNSQRAPLYVGLVCSVLIIIAPDSSDNLNPDSHLNGINAMISLIAVWICTTLVLLAKRSFRELNNSINNMESRVKEKTIRLVELNQSLEQSVQNRTKELKVRNDELQQFAYVATHDLKSPLVDIEGHFNVIKPHVKNSSKRISSSLGFIQDGFDRFNSTIESLAKVIQLRDASQEFESIDLKKILTQKIQEFKPNIEEVGGEIETELPSSAFIIGSNVFLNSILHNLISNAIKYKSDKRNLLLSISLKKQENYCLLSIQDNGLGINLDLHKNRIFKMFNRFHNHVEGKGMGLYMVHTMVEKMGGNIKIESKEDEGTIFNIFFRKAEQ